MESQNMADLDLYKSVVEAYQLLSPDKIAPIEKVNTSKDTISELLNPPLNTHKLSRQPTARLDRCNTSIFDVDFAASEEQEEILEYGFGVPFSYWKEYNYYPYIAPKYKDLKEEVLNNTIQPIIMDDWNEIYNKTTMKLETIDEILGENGDTNTPFAHDEKQWNTITGIAPKEKISLHHILCMLLYTDLDELPRKMKNVCRKMNKNEKREHVAKRHCELAKWLKLLFETIILYGNHLSVNTSSLFHGLNRKFYFRQFKAKFFIPTSTTTERSIASNFAEDGGMIMEFGGMETYGDPYFDCVSLSNYPEERERLFFFAEIPIKSVWINNTERFDMSSLSLYQSIINGNIIIDKVQSENKKKFQKTQKKLNQLLDQIESEMKTENKENDIEAKEDDEIEEYDKNLLKTFIKYKHKIWLNTKEIQSKIGMKKLREKFIQQNDDKSFKDYSQRLLDLQQEQKLEINNANLFGWTPKEKELDSFIKEENGVVSRTMKCPNGAKFYCQMNVRDKEKGRIFLILYKLPKGMEDTSITISFDIYCKAMKDFYGRFHEIRLSVGGDDVDARQGINFKMDLMEKAINKKKPIEWQLSIRFE